MVDLGSTVEGRSTRANAVSADGTVVVGWQDGTDGFRQGASWKDGVQTLYTYEFDEVDWAVGGAQAVSPDGSVIVGGSTILSGAWRWTEATGVEDIGFVDGWQYRGTAFAVSNDGNIIGGMSGFGFDRVGTIWTPETGTVPANDFFADNGIEVPDGWNIMTVLGISGDGQTLAGWAIDAGFNQFGWIATLSGAAALELTVDPLIAGSESLIQIDGAEAGSRVFLTYSLQGVGETPVPQLNVTLDIASARLLTKGNANADGHLEYLASVPAGMAGTEVWLQAAGVDVTSNVHHAVIGN